MSPLQAPPSSGYADGQRVQNWDGPVLWNVATAPTNVSLISPILDVSRYSHISGQIKSTLNSFRLTIDWYSDSTLAIAVGHVSFTVDSRMGNFMQPRISNRGPFAVIQASPIAGANFAVQAAILATNRDDPLQTLPLNPYLISVQGDPIGAGATVNVFPIDYYAGPATVWFDPAAAGIFVSLQTTSASGATQTLNQMIAPAGSPDQMLVWTMPMGVWWMRVDNPGGAGSSYFMAAVQSVTGAT